MRIGIFADSHDHIANIRIAVDRFNAEQVDLVLFAGDLVSTIAVPPLRKLAAPVVACFGDNEGNKVGLQAGFQLVGEISDAPLLYVANDGTRIVLAHMKRQLRGLSVEYDIGIVGHTHKPRIERDETGRLLINPGETSGWSFGRPTIAILETSTREVKLIELGVPPQPVARSLPMPAICPDLCPLHDSTPNVANDHKSADRHDGSGKDLL